MSKKTPVYDSCGNVFEDMGLPDAEERLAKAHLVIIIEHEIRGRGLTQVQAARILGISQPEVSDLLRGRLSRFSMERLERFLNALDLDVHIRIAPRAEGKQRAGITVERVSSP